MYQEHPYVRYMSLFQSFHYIQSCKIFLCIYINTNIHNNNLTLLYTNLPQTSFNNYNNSIITPTHISAYNEMNRSSNPSQGCSKHLGQLIQEYCNDCKQLLCLQCIATMNHHDHQLSKYSQYLGKCTIEAEDYLRRVRNVAQRTEEARGTLTNYKTKYEECYRQSLDVLESFTKVSNRMKEWKEKTINNLEESKALKLRQLEERISVLKKSREEGHPLQQKMMEIMLPEVLFFKQGKENLHKTIQQLSPRYISCQKLRVRRAKSFSSSSSNQKGLGIRSSSCSTSLSSSLVSLIDSDTSDGSEFDSSVETSRNSLEFNQSLPIVQRIQDGELPVKSKPFSRESFVEEDLSQEIYEDVSETETKLPSKSENIYFDIGEDKKTPTYHSNVKVARETSDIEECITSDTNPLSPKQDEGYNYIPFNTGEDKNTPPPLPPQYSEEEQEIYDEIGEDKRNPPPLPPRARHSVFQKKVLPFNIIAASCFAQTPNETVSLYDVCSTRDGNIVVSDPDNSCLRIATGTGENSKKITERLKEACQPKAVAYDSTHDRVLVSLHHNEEYSLGRVKIGRKIGFKEMKLEKKINPIAIASASCTSGGACCYMTVWPKSRDFSVHSFDCTGKFGGKLDVVKIPCGIDYHDSGYLVISDLKEGCLLKTTPEGKALWDKHADARTPGILNQPFGVVILPNQYVIVTESGNHRVSIFSDIGNLVVRFGCKGSDPGEFDNPQGICLHCSNELIIVDSGNRRLQIFSLESLELFFSVTDEQNTYTTCTGNYIHNI